MRRRYIGGKTPTTKERPPTKEKPSTCFIKCECGTRQITQLVPGLNDITAVCDQCGASIHVKAVYDGRGKVSVFRGTVEKVEGE